MAKGDTIKVWFSVGDRAEQAVIEASQNGRVVEAEHSKTSVEVTEKTRGGTTVRRVWFPIGAVLAIDELKREA